MNIDRKILDGISAEYGDSFYLLDTVAFERNYTELLSSFQNHYPKTNIAYSYKTNYIPKLCKLVNSLGGFAEVVSDMEYQVAIKSGVAPDKIFFNGPHKSKASTLKLLLDGGIVNADSIEEVDQILIMADTEESNMFQIGLRCNFDLNDGAISRFGFDTNHQDFSQAINMIEAKKNVNLVSLHCHFARRTLDTWETRTEKMLCLCDRVLDKLVYPLSFISLGGGIYGGMEPELRAQFTEIIPSFDNYAEVAAKPFKDYFDRSPHGAPVLIIEPGTALVANAMKFVTKVISIKSVRGKTIATVAGSNYNVNPPNLNPNPNRKNVAISVCQPNNRAGPVQQYKELDIGGYTCIESDYLYRGFNGELAVGDFIILHDVGSYSVVMKPPFILPNFAILEYHSDNDSIECIKREESLDDIFRTYIF